jgi:hypothetical protein
MLPFQFLCRAVSDVRAFTHRRMFEDFEKVEKEYYCRWKEENILRRKVLGETRGVGVSVSAP